MNRNTKIIIGIGVAVIAGIVVYYLFFKKGSKGLSLPTPSTTQTQNPSISNSSLSSQGALNTGEQSSQTTITEDCSGAMFSITNCGQGASSTSGIASDFIDTIKTISNNITKTGNDIYNSLQKDVSKPVENVFKSAENAVSSIPKTVGTLGNDLFKFTSPITSSIDNVTSQLFKVFKPAETGLAKTLSSGASSLSSVENVFKPISADVNNVVSGLSKFFHW
ncbi:MAG: hypothetical protein QW478_11375 [Candidatus Micrarchaeaceae archaeon]